MFLNLTPHLITIVKLDGTTVCVPPSGQVARVTTVTTVTDDTDGVQTVTSVAGGVVGAPAEAPGVYLIVSGMVLDAAPRSDFRAPGELVRGPDGQPIGCKGLRKAVVL
jgi:hypothetical protein